MSADALSFTGAIADILRLPDEALAMSYIYLNKYKRFLKSSESPRLLDPYTLALATLSLATKSTESPRRLRELLLPAHRLLHNPSNPDEPQQPAPQATTSEPLTIPSSTYDTLRATLVRAELLLLRVLGFELRIPLPLEYLPRYLERAMSDKLDRVRDSGDLEDYEAWSKEEKDEYGVTGLMETGLGRACRASAVEACKNYSLAILYPPRALAAGCVWSVLEKREWSGGPETGKWLDKVTGRKVDVEDFQEIVQQLKLL